jgi:formylglycine-generating enzyme required for sulfatase activity
VTPLLLVLPLLGARIEAPTGRSTEVQRPREAMIAIAAGTFMMGANERAIRDAQVQCREQIGSAAARKCDSNEAFLFSFEGPAKKVFVSAFRIDRVEVTVAAYRACVQAGACVPEPLLQPDPRFGKPDLPLTSVTWHEANQYCAWRGGRLPSEAEWERSARSVDSRTFPWGNVAEGGWLNHGKFHVLNELGPMPTPLLRPDDSDGYTLLAPAGAFTRGASADGVLDLAGNVSEWTSDGFGAEPPQVASQVNPRGPAVGQFRALRGGSFRQPMVLQRNTARNGLPPDARSSEVGFRCVK